MNAAHSALCGPGRRSPLLPLLRPLPSLLLLVLLPQLLLPGARADEHELLDHGSEHRQARQLQTAACSGNVDTGLDVICDGGSTLISNADAVVGSDAAACCQCPPGTTATYADESLGFRFRADDITLDDTGAPVWSAAAPAGFKFTSTRITFPDAVEAQEVADHDMYDFPTISPTIVAATDGLPRGLRFHAYADDGTPAAVMLFANRKIAVGAQHTLFAAVALQGTPTSFQVLIGMRVDAYETGMSAWTVGSYSTGDDSVASFGSDTWNTCGWASGPPLHPSAIQLIVARSRFGMDSDGRLGPVMEFAAVDLSTPTPTLGWASEMYGEGSKQYFFDVDETFDYPHMDFRDPTVDGLRVVGAGYMQM